MFGGTFAIRKWLNLFLGVMFLAGPTLEVEKRRSEACFLDLLSGDMVDGLDGDMLV